MWTCATHTRARGRAWACARAGAFEGIEPANVLVDEADEAKAHFYKLSRAHKVLTDDAHRRIYDESLGDGGEWLLRPAAPAAPATVATTPSVLHHALHHQPRGNHARSAL